MSCLSELKAAWLPPGSALNIAAENVEAGSAPKLPEPSRNGNRRMLSPVHDGRLTSLMVLGNFLPAYEVLSPHTHSASSSPQPGRQTPFRLRRQISPKHLISAQPPARSPSAPAIGHRRSPGNLSADLWQRPVSDPYIIHRARAVELALGFGSRTLFASSGKLRAILTDEPRRVRARPGR
jgi:hypothetical protein